MKDIRYIPETHDYRARYDANVIGFYPTHHDAETALNEYVFELIVEGLDRRASELDAGAPVWNLVTR